MNDLCRLVGHLLLLAGLVCGARVSVPDLGNASEDEVCQGTDRKWPRPEAWTHSVSHCGEILGSGSYGTVYKVARIDGEAPRYFVAKVQELTNGTASRELKNMESFKATSQSTSADAWIIQLIDSAPSSVGVTIKERVYAWYGPWRHRAGRQWTGKYSYREEQQGRQVLAMELASADLTLFAGLPPDRTRRKHTKPHTTLAPHATLELFAHVLYGLKALHEHQPNKMVHGDLKPPNVLIFGDCTVGIFPQASGGCIAKLADLGSTVKRGTFRGRYGRSPLYDAPENSAITTASRKADMWAAGMILVELVFHTVGSDLSFSAEWERSPEEKNVVAELVDGLSQKPNKRLTADGALQLLTKIGISSDAPMLVIGAVVPFS